MAAVALGDTEQRLCWVWVGRDAGVSENVGV